MRYVLQRQKTTVKLWCCCTIFNSCSCSFIVVVVVTAAAATAGVTAVTLSKTYVHVSWPQTHFDVCIGKWELVEKMCF